jgi:predicted 3-demethylubiquinone-9 3-methyltransferase (glyoxalase superfamily)
MQEIRPCLTFNDQTEEAVNFYVSLFKNSRIVELVRSPGGPIPAGKVMQASFELNGYEYTAFDGGDPFRFTEAFSMVATCDTQEEIDEVWERLCDGGEPGPCGWLKDRFGVSWQVVPKALGEMLRNPEGGNSVAVMDAVMRMGKLDLAELRRAYENGSRSPSL